MSAETVIGSSPPAPAEESTGGRHLMTVALLLMLGAAVAEMFSGFRRGGQPISNLLLTSSPIFANLACQPTVWASTREWAKGFMKVFAGILILVAFICFVMMLVELAGAARDSFQGERLRLFLYLPAGLLGMILSLAGITVFKVRGGKVFLALAGAWALMPFLFPVSLATIAFLIAKKKELLPELSTRVRRTS